MKVIGVTTCPTGIAHTYMAAEAIVKAAEAKGYDVKVETQGVKAENVLTTSEIEKADIIILACDAKIDMDRFAGRDIKLISTGRAIKECEKVLDEAENGIGLEKVAASSGKSSNGALNSNGHKNSLYNHFMSGVNMMLPFVIAGGIIIALSFAFGIHASDPTDPSYNALAYALSRVGSEATFALMVPALAGGIAYSIAGKQGMAPGFVLGMLAKLGGSGFLGGMIGGLIAGYAADFMANTLGNKVSQSWSAIYQLIVVPLVTILVVGVVFVFLIDAPIAWVLAQLTNWLNGLSGTNGIIFGILIGCMMALDMGGPVNKAISTFSIGLMSAGVNAPVAACMVAGMTPPLGIALATVLFKDRFTEGERTMGKSNWILGASYITEGAIPFAVSDLRVIPCDMVGSAIGAAISLGFGVTSMAPHGGIWVMLIPNVINNLPVYALAIASGTVVTALLLGLVKKGNKKQ